MAEWFNSLLGYLKSFVFGNALPAILVLLGGIFAVRIILKIVGKMLSKTSLEKAAITLIRSVIRTALYLVLVLLTASSLGIDVTGIVALASVLTLAISLAVQTALTNMIGGFTLLNTRPFVSGDFVEIGGQTGTVKEIGMTYTKLATADNKFISIPNGTVVSTEIINYTASGTRRVEILVTASYDDATDKVLEALLEAAQMPTVLQDPAPFVGVKDYQDSAIQYVLQVWCKTSDYRTTLFGVNKNIKDVFDAHGVTMTYPHLNVHLDK